MAQVSSRGCSKAFLICVLWHAWQHVKLLKSKKMPVVFPFTDSLINQWLNNAHRDCNMGGLSRLFGGIEYIESDKSTYWSEPNQFLTWWKNNVERKDKFTKIVLRALGNNSRDINSLRYSRQMVALSINIKSHFDRVIKPSRSKSTKNISKMNTISEYPPVIYPHADINLQQHYLISKNYKSQVKSSPKKNTLSKSNSQNLLYHQQYEQLLKKDDISLSSLNLNNENLNPNSMIDNKISILATDLTEKFDEELQKANETKSEEVTPSSSASPSASNSPTPSSPSASMMISSNIVATPSNLPTNVNSFSSVVQIALPFPMPQHLIQELPNDSEIQYIEVDFHYIPILVNLLRDLIGQVQTQNNEEEYAISRNWAFLNSIKKEMMKHTNGMKLNRGNGWEGEMAETPIAEIHSRPGTINSGKVGIEFSAYELSKIINYVFCDINQPTTANFNMEFNGNYENNSTNASYCSHFNETSNFNYSMTSPLKKTKYTHTNNINSPLGPSNYSLSNPNTVITPTPSTTATSTLKHSTSTSSLLAQIKLESPTPIPTTNLSRSNSSTNNFMMNSKPYYDNVPPFPHDHHNGSNNFYFNNGVNIPSFEYNSENSNQLFSMPRIDLENNLEINNSNNLSLFDENNDKKINNNSQKNQTNNNSNKLPNNELKNMRNNFQFNPAPGTAFNTEYKKKQKNYNSRKSQQINFSSHNNTQTFNNNSGLAPNQPFNINPPQFKDSTFTEFQAFYNHQPNNIEHHQNMFHQANPSQMSNYSNNNNNNTNTNNIYHNFPNLYDNDASDGDSFIPSISGFQNIQDNQLQSQNQQNHSQNNSQSNTQNNNSILSNSFDKSFYIFQNNTSSVSSIHDMRSTSMDAVDKLMENEIEITTELSVENVDIDETIASIDESLMYHKNIDMCGPDITEYLQANDWRSNNMNNINISNNEVNNDNAIDELMQIFQTNDDQSYLSPSSFINNSDVLDLNMNIESNFFD